MPNLQLVKKRVIAGNIAAVKRQVLQTRQREWTKFDKRRSTFNIFPDFGDHLSWSVNKLMVQPLSKHGPFKTYLFGFGIVEDNLRNDWQHNITCSIRMPTSWKPMSLHMRNCNQTRTTMAHNNNKLSPPSKNLLVVTFIMENNKITWK